MTPIYHPSSLSFSGLDIHVSDTMIEQHRKPRSKKRRIRAKWAKRPGNWRPMRGALKSGNAVYMHPQTLAIMQRQMGDEMAARVDERIRVDTSPQAV